MSVSKFTLVMLSIAGCWRPYSWTSLIKHMLYNVYTLLVISVIYIFTFTQFMEIVLNVNNPEDFTEILYVMLTMCISCYKILNLWLNHEDISALIQKFNKGLFRPLVPAEIEIRWKFDKLIKNLEMNYIILIETVFAGNILLSLMTDFRKRKLTFREWVPYNYSSFMIYCLTYTYQYVSILASILVNISCDSLIIGLLLHLCCQITILKYRIKCIANNPRILRNCIRHHYYIIECVRETNVRFTKIIMFQFVVSTFVVCSNMFQLTKTTLGVYHISLITYTLCIFIQIFMYCWFGNKLKLMSLQVVDTIFEMEWITLNNKTKKSLLIFMNRAMIPLEFTSAHILNLNLNSFVALLKTSYSAYNLLVKVQE